MARDKRRTDARVVERKVGQPVVVTRLKTLDKLASRTHDEFDAEQSDDGDKPIRRLPFRFLDLPSELRLRIYEEVLSVKTPIDLDPMNYRRISPRLCLFLVNHQVHEEAYRVFYSQTVRLSPTHGRFFHTKKPLLQRLPARYRSAINSMELRIGPGWSAPPRGQKITSELGLVECTNLRTLHIFVELDPGEQVFAGFRGRNATEDTYKDFCLELLAGIYERVPSLMVVEVDAFPGVRQDSSMIIAIQRQVKEHGMALIWGPLRGWTKSIDETGLVGLERFMASMDITENPRLVGVLA